MTPADAGLEAVAFVRNALDPESTRVLGEERGFRWWPHAHTMRVWAEAPRPDGACVVAVETALLGGVEGRGTEFGRIAQRNARHPGLSALRWNGETRELSLRASVVVRPGDGDASVRRIAHAALLQVGESLEAGEALAVEFPGATLLAPPAPVAGVLEPAPQVEAWEEYARVAQLQAEEFPARLHALPALKPAPWLNVQRAGHGIDAEIPTVSGLAPTAPGEGLALLRISATQPHPRLGPGMVVVLVPPPETEPVAERAAATAALLNEGESREWTGFDQLGAWCVHPSVGLSHAMFVPALAVEDDLPQVLAWQSGMRARWCREFLMRVAAMRKGPSSPEA